MPTETTRGDATCNAAGGGGVGGGGGRTRFPTHPRLDAEEDEGVVDCVEERVEREQADAPLVRQNKRLDACGEGRG